MAKAARIGLALSGGSALGFAHLGVLRALTDHDIPLGSIAGTSAGAIAAACYAFNIPDEQVTKKVTALSWGAISKIAPSKFGLLSNHKLGAILHDVFGNPNIEDASIPLAIVATDITAGKKVVFRTGNLVQALLASSAIPAIFSPVTIDDHLFLDGGLVELLPVSTLSNMGADVQIGVNVMKRYTHAPPKNWFDIIDRSNHLLYQAQFDSLPQDVVYIEPNLDDFTGSDFAKHRELILEGYRATALKIADIQTLRGKKRSLLQGVLHLLK